MYRVNNNNLLEVHSDLINSITNLTKIQAELINQNKESLFVTGVCWEGKTSALVLLEKQGYPVVSGDFAEYCSVVPEFKEKHTDPRLTEEYLLFTTSKIKPGFIHDRFPGDSFIYGHIWDVMYNKKSLQTSLEEFERSCKRTMIPYIQSQKLNILIIVPAYLDALVERMKKRNAIYDDYGEPYASVQNVFYRKFCEVCNVEFAQVDDPSLVPGIIKEIYERINTPVTNGPVVLYTLLGNPLNRGTAHSAGLDVPIAETVT
uniref:Uncharacterized protein n=1 Tax=Cacopsylla melanoneura TaxID=428564 RepID=A0A8D9BHH6_9HEMI